MFWIYDLPTWLLCALVIAAYAVVAMTGLRLLRPWARRAAGDAPHSHNELVNYFLSAGGVLYGLLLGLVAVGAWQNRASAESVVTREATALAALYRDVSVYPEPTRGDVQRLIREYTRFVIDEAWPLQRRGEVPTGGIKKAGAIYQRLSEFTPATPGEIALHQEALRQFNHFFEARRERLDAVRNGLPAAIWCVVGGGSLIMLGISWLFVAQNFRLHMLLTLSLAVTTGLMVFLTVAMDHPFRGRFSIGSDHYELVLEQLMGQRASTP